MENRPNGGFRGFSEIASTLFSTERARKVAALSIDASERLARSALDYQAKARAKDTPLGPLFEAQNSIGRKFVEISVDTARRLWNIDARQAA